MELNPTTRWYQANAGRWTGNKTNSFLHEAQFKFFRSYLPPIANVLDVGCANGIHVPMFLGIGRGIEYMGVDCCDDFLRIARRRYPHLQFRSGDITDASTLPLRKFNGIWCAATLMHVSYEQMKPALETLRQKLTSPGIGYFSLPLKHPNPNRITDGDTRLFTLLTETQQRNLFSENGWEIIEETSMDSFDREDVWRSYIVRKVA